MREPTLLQKPQVTVALERVGCDSKLRERANPNGMGNARIVQTTDQMARRTPVREGPGLPRA